LISFGAGVGRFPGRVLLITDSYQSSDTHSSGDGKGVEWVLVQVLANFQAAKGEWREAAAAHLAYARRMQEEGYPSSAISTRLGMLSSSPQHHQSVQHSRTLHCLAQGKGGRVREAQIR